MGRQNSEGIKFAGSCHRFGKVMAVSVSVEGSAAVSWIYRAGVYRILIPADPETTGLTQTWEP